MSGTIKSLASKLGLLDDPKVIIKASEFERLLQTRMSIGKLMNDSCQAVICLDLAADVLGKVIDKKEAIKYSGVKSLAYTNHRYMVENILNIKKSKITTAQVCLLAQCIEAQDLADEILKKYQKMVKEVDLSIPQYICVSVYEACRLMKIKVSKNKLIEISRLRTNQWSKLHEEWAKFVKENFKTRDTNKKKTPTKSLAKKIEDEASEDTSKKKLKPNNDVDSDEEKAKYLEEYKLWKNRILQRAYKEIKKANKLNKIIINNAIDFDNTTDLSNRSLKKNENCGNNHEFDGNLKLRTSPKKKNSSKPLAFDEKTVRGDTNFSYNEKTHLESESTDFNEGNMKGASSKPKNVKNATIILEKDKGLPKVLLTRLECISLLDTALKTNLKGSEKEISKLGDGNKTRFRRVTKDTKICQSDSDSNQEFQTHKKVHSKTEKSQNRTTKLDKLKDSHSSDSDSNDNSHEKSPQLNSKKTTTNLNKTQSGRPSKGYVSLKFGSPVSTAKSCPQINEVFIQECIRQSPRKVLKEKEEEAISFENSVEAISFDTIDDDPLKISPLKSTRNNVYSPKFIARRTSVRFSPRKLTDSPRQSPRQVSESSRQSPRKLCTRNGESKGVRILFKD